MTNSTFSPQGVDLFKPIVILRIRDRMLLHHGHSVFFLITWHGKFTLYKVNHFRINTWGSHYKPQFAQWLPLVTFKTLSSLQSKTIYLLSIFPLYPLSWDPAGTKLCSVSTDLSILSTPYQWNHTISYILCLAFFT